MADVSIDATVSTSTARGMRSVVFTTSLIGYWFLIHSDGKLSLYKTTDGGASWSVLSVITTITTTNIAFDVWFDKWTPGDSGTKIHLWWFDSTNDLVFYYSFDTSNDTFGAQRTAFTGASAVAGRGAFCSGTKTTSGHLYVAFMIDSGVEHGLVKSTDGGTTWSANLNQNFVPTSLEQCLLFPASGTGGVPSPNDYIMCLYHQPSVNLLISRGWDVAITSNSGNTAMIYNATDLTGQMGFSGAIRLSDGHVIGAVFSDRDTATASLKIVDLNFNGGQTNLTVIGTAITTNIDDMYNPAVFIDQNTNAIYVAYNGKKDGSEVLGTTTKIYYVKSTDGGTTWSAEQPYQEGAAAAAFQVWAPISGPRFYVGWRVGTTLKGNAVNSVDVTPVVSLPELIQSPMTPAWSHE